MEQYEVFMLLLLVLLFQVMVVNEKLLTHLLGPVRMLGGIHKSAILL